MLIAVVEAETAASLVPKCSQFINCLLYSATFKMCANGTHELLTFMFCDFGGVIYFIFKAP